MLRNRSGRVLEMGSVRIMICITRYIVLKQTLEPISAGACTLSRIDPTTYAKSKFTTLLVMP